MFDAIIRFSLENKLIVLLGVLAMAVVGVFSASQIPLDAVPDITNNQVQIVSVAPTFAPEEVEQLITYPLEAAMTNIPDVVEVRSISRYGLSVITIVFEEQVAVQRARQFVQEQLNVATGELPPSVETELMPITTGLGEIYQYVLTVDKAHAHLYDATELRTIHDWIVKRQLNGTEGIIEVSSFGGYLKQYEVAINPQALKTYGLGLSDVITALENNNENSGGSYLEKGSYSYYIRTEGRVSNAEEIGEIPLGNPTGPPLRIRDVAQITIGSAKRYGAMTMDGQGEVVGGITLMLKGANSSEALRNVEQRMAEIIKSLPAGVGIYPYLDRSRLIEKTIATVSDNLIEGGLIVIFVLLLLLGNLRAGLIVASVIPLSMLFALSLMRYFGISANLMSLGAIDFGIVIDGAVIIVEGLLHTLAIGYVGQRLTQPQLDQVVRTSTATIYRSAAFGVLIILFVFLPILTLEGTEGKTFRPMAQTVSFAILGSLLLSVTYVPIMASLFINKNIKAETGFAARIMGWLQRLYRPVVAASMRSAWATIGVAAVALVLSVLLFSKLGAEFIPTLEEGDIAMQQAIKPGSSLQESIHTSTMAERILLDNFPEVKHVVSKIGTAEVPTDPMAIEDADIMILLKNKEEWTSASNREELMAKMKEKLAPITWASFEFTQPIQLRFNELMTGAKSDISIKLFGEDPEELKAKAEEIASIVETISGAGDVKVDQTDGLQQLSVRLDRNRMAQFGVSVNEVNQAIRAAYAGEVVGNIYEAERKFDLVVRLAADYRQDLDLTQLSLPGRGGSLVPLSEVATVEERESPMLISRESARRFINVGVNVRERDVASLVAEIQQELGQRLTLLPGYEIRYGGQFESLQRASQRLLIAVPLALALILLLLYLSFGTFRDALVIFVAVPLSAIGGILALQLRGMPFSISSGIGFIALFGISVLNGIVLISAIKQLMQQKKGKEGDFKVADSEQGAKPTTTLLELIIEAAASRLRPVLMTAAVAAFGFLPMALSSGNGAEVQRPLATVVIGGLISSTLLTLVVLPALFYVVNKRKWASASAVPLLLLLLFTWPNHGKAQATLLDFDGLYSYVLTQHPSLKNQQLNTEAAALNRKKIGAWSPLNITYQGGQINTGDVDHSFSATQTLNHLFNRSAQVSVVDASLAVSSAELNLLKRNLHLSLRTAYETWAYQHAHSQLVDSVYQLHLSLASDLDLRYQAGVIGVLDLELFKQELADYRQQLSAATATTALAENELRALAFLPDSLRIAVPLTDKLAWSDTLWDVATSPALELVNQRSTYLTTEQELANRLAHQPQLSVGYFVQTIEKDFAFQGGSIGLGIPLDRRENNARQQQTKLYQQQLSNEQQQITESLRLRTSGLARNLRLLENELLRYDAEIAAGQERILSIARLQLQQGEIDFLSFSQLTRRILDQRLGYLQRVHQFNLYVIELHSLTSNQQ